MKGRDSNAFSSKQWRSSFGGNEKNDGTFESLKKLEMKLCDS